MKTRETPPAVDAHERYACCQRMGVALGVMSWPQLRTDGTELAYDGIHAEPMSTHGGGGDEGGCGNSSGVLGGGGGRGGDDSG